MDYKDRKYARLALERLGEVVEAVVVDEESPPLARAEGFLKGARIVLGKGLVERLSRVRVRLMDVDVASAKIYGKVVGIIKEKRV
jgi:ribonuclease R